MAAREALDEADLVFEGKVVDSRRVEDESSLAQVEVSFAVGRVWKGPASAELRVLTPCSSAACGFGFRRGNAYLVFAYQQLPSNDYQTNLCSLTTPIEEARRYVDALESAALSTVP